MSKREKQIYRQGIKDTLLYMSAIVMGLACTMKAFAIMLMA